jgi:RNA polymerase sigma-70 factor (ECF subfamily)
MMTFVGEDSRLVDLARGGSAEAFTAIILRHQERVRGYLGRFTRDAGTVDDLAQEVFLNAYTGLPKYRAELPLVPWLLGIARNLALMKLREETRRNARENRKFESTMFGWHAERAGSGVEEPSGHLRHLGALETCLDRLPSESAHLVREHYFESRSVVDIARQSGRREGAVRMTLLRIRQALGECVRRRLAGQEE